MNKSHNELNASSISVDENSGNVKTTTKVGRAHVLITSTEDFDIIQSLDVPIEVNILNFYSNN